MKRSMPRLCESSICEGSFTAHERACSTITLAGCMFHGPAKNPSYLTALPDTTTASTLTFVLWELAKSPGTQRRVREEIIAARREVLKSARTDEIPFSYYEKMPLLIALTKVYRDPITNVCGNELTFWHKGSTQDASGPVQGPQASIRR